MRLPGIEIRPLKAINGQLHFSQVFYNNVRIPLSHVVGEVNGGWSVAMATLGFERGTANIGHQVELAELIDKLVDYARHHPAADGRPAIEDPNFNERLAAARAEVRGLRALTYATVSRAARQSVPGAEGSIVRLFHSELLQRVARLGFDLAGTAGLERAAQAPLVKEYLESFWLTIAGGTAEIQRNIIGERELGLPRVR
jgi:alkylation response protein AidB-like acyl-CoA dehydrogenase